MYIIRLVNRTMTVDTQQFQNDEQGIWKLMFWLFGLVVGIGVVAGIILFNK